MNKWKYNNIMKDLSVKEDFNLLKDLYNQKQKPRSLQFYDD